jgi:hypothetical protein
VDEEEPTDQELGAIARSIIDSNRFMALGTADESGLASRSSRGGRKHRNCASGHRRTCGRRLAIVSTEPACPSISCSTPTTGGCR